MTEHGLHDATTDPDQIRDWWRRWPEANIGIRMGRESGLVVLDEDPRNGGDETIKRYTVPQTLRVRTGGGGRHYYFQHPADRTVRGGTGKLGPGLDLQADGDYVVAVPSNHLKGMYRWDPVGPSHEQDVPVAECPSWILALDAGSNGGATRHTPAAGPADETTQSVARKCLELLDPARADNYDGWVQVGMICHRAGLSCDEYDKWSQQSSKYQAGEPEQKWRSFSADRENSLGVGTLIFRAAQDQGMTTGELLAKISPGFHLTDAGNATRFAMENAHHLRYVPQWGKWIEFDGTRWNGETGDAKAVQLAMGMARSMLVQAAQVANDDDRNKLIKHAQKSESEARIRAMLSLAKNLPSLIVPARQLDLDPFLLNAMNGTIDLRTGTLRPYNSADLLTKISPVEYDPRARLQMWDDHLRRVMAGDQELIDFLQVAAGYTATGDTGEEVLFLVHGPAAGGKTTTIEAIKAVLGDYAQTADFETFLQRNQVGGIRNDIARLAGARLVSSVEVDEGKRLAEGLVKTLTGGDTVTARFLYREAFEFKPACKLWLVCNEVPRVNDMDDAMWRRIHSIPFEHPIPKEQRDPQVKRMLKDPTVGGPAVLAWLVEGCSKWRSNGLSVPNKVEQATRKDRESQDPLQEFFEDRCIFEPRAHEPVTSLREDYEKYARDSGNRSPVSLREFNNRLEVKGCKRQSFNVRSGIHGSGYKKCWVGVRLRTPADRNPGMIRGATGTTATEDILRF